MKQRTKGKKGGRRREWMIGAGLIAYMIGLIIRIPLSHMIGDKGIGFFAAGMEVFTVISVVLSYGIAKAVTALIKYRVKRDMFKSARRVYRNAMLLTVIISVPVSAGVFLFSEFIAETLVLEYMGYLAIAAAAPAIFLSMVMGVLRGYFQGMGTMIPTVHSRLIEKVIMLVLSLILGSALYNYGLKVAAVLKYDECASAYGAMGAAMGVSAACVFGVLHLIFIQVIYSGTFKQQMMRDSSKYTESGVQIVSMLLTTALPYMLSALLYNMNYLVDQRIFNYAMNVKEQSSIRVAHWGIYYGKYSVIIGIPAVLFAWAGITGVPRIVQLYEKQERREAQVKLERSIHYLAVITIPCAVFISVLAEPIVGILFKGDISTAVKLVQTGSCVIVLFAYSYFFMGILQRIRKIRIVIFAGLAAFLFHLVFLFLLINNTDMGITAVVCGTIIFWLATCAAGFVGIIKILQYSQEWLRTFGMTIISAGLSGLVGMLLCKVLLPVAGNVITLIICLIFCIISYNMILILLKGVREEELEDMPGGNLIIFAAKKLRFM